MSHQWVSLRINFNLTLFGVSFGIGRILKGDKITLEGNPVIIVGNYGSGKTEVAVNLARHLAENGQKGIKLVDLDIVNPYFRSREAKESLKPYGIEVISPEEDEHYAELPIISPKIKAEIEMGKSTVILDVGGDDVGARVLSSLNDVIREKKYELLIVLNINRPFTEDIKGCLKMMDEIEASSKLKITGVISNTHFIEETTPETVSVGYKVVLEVGKKKNIPVKFIAVSSSIVEKLDAKGFSCPILPIDRMMLKPWEKMKINFRGPLRGL